MKYLPHLLLTTATAFALAFGAMAADPAVASDTQLGPHSAQKFAIVKHLISRRSIDPNARTEIALVLTVEQTMIGKQVQITAKASAHKDGPHGILLNVAGLRVHVLQPSDFGTEPQKTGEARITKTIDAPGGVYKTVVAEATINSPDYPDTTVSLTIPGGK
jgi:hypothetical protein